MIKTSTKSTAVTTKKKELRYKGELSFIGENVHKFTLEEFEEANKLRPDLIN